MTETTHPSEEVAQTTEAVGGIGALGVNGTLFLAQLFNFGILLFVMWKWVYRPLMRKMDERTKKIEDGLDFAKQATARLNEIGDERERIVRDAKIEAHALIEDAALKVEFVRKTKSDETAKEIEKMLADAKMRITQEREATFETLRGDVANLVALAVRKAMDGLDEKSREALVKKAIDGIGDA